MNNVFKYIGVITLAIVMLGIPVLCTLSFVLSWSWIVFAILFFLTVLDVFAFIVGLCKFATISTLFYQKRMTHQMIKTMILNQILLLDMNIQR